MIIPLLFNFENEYSLIIPNLADSINKIQLLGEYIHDWAGNTFIDSVKACIKVIIESNEPAGN